MRKSFAIYRLSRSRYLFNKKPFGRLKNLHLSFKFNLVVKVEKLSRFPYECFLFVPIHSQRKAFYARPFSERQKQANRKQLYDVFIKLRLFILMFECAPSLKLKLFEVSAKTFKVDMIIMSAHLSHIQKAVLTFPTNISKLCSLKESL